MNLKYAIGMISLLLVLSACDITDNYVRDYEYPSQSRVSEAQSLISGQETTNATLLDIAASADDFSILAQAVLFAGLDEVLGGRRQLTVFAPTNQAFVDLLESLGDDAENLYNNGEFVSGNEQFVRDILLYHVAPGKREAEDVVTADRIRTQNRSFVFVKQENESFFVGNDTNGFAEIIATDIPASNGVIHVIDAVMLP